MTVTLGLTEKAYRNELFAEIMDNGAGMTESQVEEILKGEGKTTKGTSGEKGFGFGLPIVKQLVDGVKCKKEKDHYGIERIFFIIV